MSLESPTSDTGRAIRTVTFRHATMATFFYASTRIADLNEDASEEDLDTFTQAFIDLIDDSPDFEFGSGAKEYSTRQSITPTI